MKGYTSRDVAKLLGLTVAQVRGFARDGFLTPPSRSGRGTRRKLQFSFQDLVILQTAKALVAARIPTRRIRHALKQLRHQLPRGRSLAELRITAEGDRIVVSDGYTAWNPESGQTHLDFAVSDLATRAAPIARRTAQAARAAEGDLDAADWYELGLELEAVEPGEARDAYRRALELDAHHADAHVNLGRLLHEQGMIEEAERHYRLALRESPDHTTAAFNLGIALEDLNQPGDAIEAYRDELVPPRPARLAELEAEARRTGFPIIGPATGHLCYLLTRLSNARQVFELGSGFGYSTAWFARAVKENGGGIVHHVVWDDRLSREARENLVALGLADVVQFHVGEAVAALQEAAGPFDVIFNDIDKQDYPKALDVITTKLRPGGLLLVDNMLWSGRIFERRDTSPATRGVRELTRRVQADPRWIASVIPLRDGLLVAQRVEEPLGLSDTLNTRAKESSR